MVIIYTASVLRKKYTCIGKSNFSIKVIFVIFSDDQRDHLVEITRMHLFFMQIRGFLLHFCNNILSIDDTSCLLLLRYVS